MHADSYLDRRGVASTAWTASSRAGYNPELHRIRSASSSNYILSPSSPPKAAIQARRELISLPKSTVLPSRQNFPVSQSRSPVILSPSKSRSSSTVPSTSAENANLPSKFLQVFFITFDMYGMLYSKIKKYLGRERCSKYRNSVFKG